jgi:KaiC/GvpD/RAD55 family RecA-like ATPase
MPQATADASTPPAGRNVTVPGPAAKGSAAAKTPPKSTAKAAPAPGSRSVTVPAPEDFELAKNDALLQLKIGRAAHLYAIFISAALALDGILILLFYPQLPTLGSSESGGVALGHSFFLILPLVAGLAIAGTGLIAKWEVYQLWPWETHFSVTVAAVAVNALIAVTYILRIAAVRPFASLTLFPWFYPVELAGISLAMLGIVLTWTGWTGRQWASALCAVLPVATALFVYFPGNTASVAAALSVSLFLSAIFYQTSGSFLHLISSGTRPHERELITSGQSRMFHLADELRQREEALHFREAALVKREADVENQDLSVRRQGDSLKAARAQLDDLEQDYRKRSDAVAEKERTWAGRIAEMDGRGRLVEDKTKALELREQEVSRLIPQISTREQRLVERESEQAKRDVELTQRQQELERRFASVPETEARLESRRKELDQKTQELLRREGEVSAKEIAVGGGKAVPTAVSQDLANREVKLQQFKTVLDEQNVLLGKKAKDVAERAKTVEAALKRSAQKEAEVAGREAAVRQREAELADQLKAADERRQQYESAAKDYSGRLEEYNRQSVSTAQKGADLDRSLKALSDREAAAAAKEAQLKSLTTDVERRERDLTARERALQANEQEVSLRRQAIGRGSGDLSFASLAAVAAADGLDTPGGPPRTRGAGARSQGIRDLSESPASAAGAPEAETLSAPVARRFADRLPTGTPRLDDLLLGGFSPHGHFVLVGDAFVGKEVVLYSFIAEGLKRGEPAILVTASRSPNEVSQSLGVVLPQFREYEQMGMVRWIDASGSGGASDAHHTVVKGSDDRAGILSSLVQSSNAVEAARPPAFRVGFLGLSAVLAHGDERAGFSFLQNVVGILKPRNSLVVYSLEAGALSEPAVETLLSRMDGALLFRQDRDRLLLSVKGFGDVETRDWIECRVTQRALIVGSFALERIR